MTGHDHAATRVVGTRHVRRQATGHHCLTVAEVHVGRERGDVPGDADTWARRSVPIDGGEAS